MGHPETLCFLKLQLLSLLQMKFLLSCLLVAAALPLHAEMIRITYSGTVSSLTYADCTSLNNGSCDAWSFTPIASTNFIPSQQIAVGEGFSGSFIYDASVTAIMSDDGYQAIFLNSVPEALFQASNYLLPNSVLPMAPTFGNFAVVDGRNGADVFQVGATYSKGDYFANMYLSMVDLTGTAISGFTAPTSLQMSQFGYNALQLGMLRRSDGDQVQLAGAVTSISFAPAAAAVPEPSTALLVLFGGALVLWAARRPE